MHAAIFAKPSHELDSALFQTGLAACAMARLTIPQMQSTTALTIKRYWPYRPCWTAILPIQGAQLLTPRPQNFLGETRIKVPR